MGGTGGGLILELDPAVEYVQIEQYFNMLSMNSHLAKEHIAHQKVKVNGQHMQNVYTMYTPVLLGY